MRVRVVVERERLEKWVLKFGKSVRRLEVNGNVQEARQRPLHHRRLAQAEVPPPVPVPGEDADSKEELHQI